MKTILPNQIKTVQEAKDLKLFKTIKEIFRYIDGRLLRVRCDGKANQRHVGKLAGFICKNKDGDRYMLKINGKDYLNSRIVFLWHHGYLPPCVDHIDHDTLNDKIENLRAATYSENAKNRISHSNSSSIYLGVSFDKSYFKWRADIRALGTIIPLGKYKTEERAALEYNKAAVKYHKEFANLNIIKK